MHLCQKLGIINKETKVKSEEWEQIPLLISIKGCDILSKIEEKVEKLVEEKIKNLGYDLYDVEYCKEGKNYFLRIFIDK